jgi:uncharacterized alkaline shock family protein YloU
MVTQQLQTTTKVDRRDTGNGDMDGTVEVRPSAVAKVAGMTVREMPGVSLSAMGGLLASLMSKAPGLAAEIKRAVRADVVNGEATVDVWLRMDYGQNVPDVVAEVRRRIEKNIRIMAGLPTRRINIEVTDITLPDTEPPTPSA